MPIRTVTTPGSFAEQFDAIRQQRTLLIGMLFLFVIVIFWIALSLFSSQQKFAVPKEMRDLAAPLSPLLDEKVLSAVEQKRVYEPTELSSFTIYKFTMDTAERKLKLVDISYKEEVKPAQSSSGSAGTSQSKLSGIATPNPSDTATSSAAQPASGSAVASPAAQVIVPTSVPIAPSPAVAP